MVDFVVVCVVLCDVASFVDAAGDGGALGMRPRWRVRWQCVFSCLCVCAPAVGEILVVTQRAGRRERRRIVLAMLDDRAGRAMRRAGLWQGGVGGYASWG